MIRLVMERIETHDKGIIITDYVGDIVNLLINKSKPYRIVYLPEWDVYGIGDAYKFIHGDIEDALNEFGYSISKRTVNLKNKRFPDFVMRDVDLDSVVLSSFEPYNTKDADWEVRGFEGERSSRTYIKTGIIKTARPINVLMPDLYNKLKINGLLMTEKDVQQILTDLKEQAIKYQDDELLLIDEISKLGNEVNKEYTGCYNFLKKYKHSPTMRDIFISGDILNYESDTHSNYWYEWSHITAKIGDIFNSIKDINEHGLDYFKDTYPWEEF